MASFVTCLFSFSWNVLLIWVFGFLFSFFCFFTAGGYPESFFMLLFVVLVLSRSHVGYIGKDQQILMPCLFLHERKVTC